MVVSSIVVSSNAIATPGASTKAIRRASAVPLVVDATFPAAPKWRRRNSNYPEPAAPTLAVQILDTKARVVPMPLVSGSVAAMPIRPSPRPTHLRRIQHHARRPGRPGILSRLPHRGRPAVNPSIPSHRRTNQPITRPSIRRTVRRRSPPFRRRRIRRFVAITRNVRNWIWWEIGTCVCCCCCLLVSRIVS